MPALLPRRRRPRYHAPFGAIDDAWKNAKGQIHVADKKATSKAELPTAAGLHPAYRRHAEVYQFLLRHQPLDVSDTAYFV